MHVRVRRSLDWRNHQRRGVRITIADTGHGIEASRLERIFEAFYTTKGDNGTGLGLWIARDLIQKHGGTIRVHSSTSLHRRGSAFSVFLPYEASGQITAQTSGSTASRLEEMVLPS